MPMYGYGFLIGIALIAVFWFMFIAPMERRLHERKMELMRRKLERNEERLRLQMGNEPDENPADAESAADGKRTVCR